MSSGADKYSSLVDDEGVDCPRARRSCRTYGGSWASNTVEMPSPKRTLAATLIFEVLYSR